MDTHSQTDHEAKMEALASRRTSAVESLNALAWWVVGILGFLLALALIVWS